MLEKYVEQITNTFNYADTVIITNENAYIEYYMTYRPDVNTNDPKNLLGRHVLEAWPTDLDENSSTILRTIKTGKAVVNEYQEFHYGDIVMPSLNTTLPVTEHGRLVGTATMVKYLWAPFARNEIALDLHHPDSFTTTYSIQDIQGCSESIAYLKQRIRLVATSDSPVLIYGETGVGKELVAQSIHGLSNRKNKKFVSQNCAAIPETLLESTLFGSIRGAYTGAETRPGLFEMAKGGTLFLDEVNSMPLVMQAKILKAIEDKTVMRVGGSTPIATDVRIISAINEYPIDCIKNGKLRRDLFYRLSVVEIDIDPLRKRKEDIDYMINFYINRFNAKMNRAVTGLDDDVNHIFHSYDWPGNVRELKNILEGAFNVATSQTIKAMYLPNYLLNRTDYLAEPRTNDYLIKWSNGAQFSLPDALREYEKSAIEAAVQNSASYTEAAAKLGITRQHLHYKMRAYGLH